MSRLELTCGPSNAVSLRVAERCGFVREGVLRSHRVFKGGRRASVMFSLLPGETSVGPVSSSSENGQEGVGVVVRAASLPVVRAIAEFQIACWREAYLDLDPSSYLDRVDADDRQVRGRESVATGTRHVAVGHVAHTLAGVVSWGTSA